MDIAIHCNTDDEILFSHIKHNSLRDLPWIKQVPEHDGHAIIVGGGASLADNLESIRWRVGLEQKLFALNNSAKYLYEHGFSPDYQVIVDAREHNKNFVEHIYANEALLASQCHPAVFDAAKNVTLWHPVIEGIENYLPDVDFEYAMVGGGTTVGLSSMCLAYAMGYRKIHLYGFDSSHKDEAGHAYEQPENEKEPVVKVRAYGRNFDCSLAMAYQAELFPECCNNLIKLGCVITCDGDGLLPWSMKHMFSEPMHMEEEDKYKAMWANPEYRNFSPGELIADKAVEVMGVTKKDSVIDFGCGSGRGGNRISELVGCFVKQVDFADNCRDADAILPFEVKDLSKPIRLHAKFGYCTDVMEHIPPDQVDQVIKNIMDCVWSCFFQISLIHDDMGVLIGQHLHLTVKPFEWWEATFDRLGYKVLWSENQDISAMFYLTTKE